jgi:hypothetical protein
MTHRALNGRVALVLLVGTIGLTGCSTSPVITITNRSDTVLTNVVVSGSGFSEHIESLAPGRSRAVTVRPRGESGLRVSFDSHGRHVDVDNLAYLEASGGYRVAVNVQSDLTVDAKATLWPHH